MNLRARFRGWLRQRRRQRAARRLNATLREFVYLDDVSVFSLLASRIGAVAAEFTDTESNSLKSESQGTLGATVGVLKGQARSKLESTVTHSSQVLRKATIQATFKDLYYLEKERLALRPIGESVAPPRVKTPADLRAGFGEPAFEGWMVSPHDWRRGQMVELEIELSTDPIFRMSAILNSLLEIISESPEMFPVSVKKQMQSAMTVNRMLEHMMVGLIPIQGRSTDYVVVRLQDEPVLVHRRLIAQMTEPIDQQDLLIVGVAEQRLFWKDVRQVLYSDSKFRVLSRITREGLADSWKPVKMVDLLGNVTPHLPKALSEFKTVALHLLAGGIEETQQDDVQATRMFVALVEYAKLLAEAGNVELTGETSERVTDLAVKLKDSHANLAARREAFSQIRDSLKLADGADIDADRAAAMRVTAIESSGLGFDGELPDALSARVSEPQESANAQYLDTEVIAIYW